jgi:hypothetical protein
LVEFVPSESTPYWITIAVATVAWLFTSATDQVLRTPYLVYDVNHQLNQQTASLIDTTVTIENITDDKSYSDVELRINADEPDIILDGKVRPDQPAWEGDEAQSFTPIALFTFFLRFSRQEGLKSISLIRLKIQCTCFGSKEE